MRPTVYRITLRVESSLRKGQQIGDCPAPRCLHRRAMSRPAAYESRPMCQSYWERVSKEYNREIQSVFEHDLEGLVKARIIAAGLDNPSGSSADIGCGIGNFTPLLAQAFASVEACDWAESALERATQRCRDYDNTTIQNLDICNDPIPFEPVDFAICINVLIMPGFDDRMKAWRAVTNQISQGGTLLLVVPSHESTQMEYYRDIENRLKMGDNCQEAAEACTTPNATIEDLQQGIFSCEGTRMKYYLKDELLMLLNGQELDVVETKRIQYSETIDNDTIETWDWLVMAKRRSVEEN